MNLTIKKGNASLGYDFLVCHGEENILSAEVEKFFGIRMSIWTNTEKIIEIKNKRFSFYKPGYWIYYLNEKIEFKTNSLYTRHFQFEYNRNIYEIYGHHKTWKYSVYQNNNQVAWWDKRTQKWEGPDFFDIVMNDDCNRELIVSFCLILDDIIDFAIDERGKIISMDGTINLDWKKYGEVKSFNKNWRPQKK